MPTETTTSWRRGARTCQPQSQYPYPQIHDPGMEGREGREGAGWARGMGGCSQGGGGRARWLGREVGEVCGSSWGGVWAGGGGSGAEAGGREWGGGRVVAGDAQRAEA